MLYDVIDNYFGQNPINILLKNELKNIKKMKITDTFQDVGKYRSDKFSDEKTFKRNFFAHAGLINGLVFIKKYQNNIILEFRDKFNLGDSTKDIDWIVDNII
jgi:CRISPR/Cas system-associated protein Csx1